MIQGAVVKILFNQIMKRLEKTSDKRIASNHEKRIVALEKKYKSIYSNLKCTK
jgi:DNA-binding ferritin-like protein (Dps family)